MKVSELIEEESYLVAVHNALVGNVREGFARDETSSPPLNLKLPFLKHNPTLTDHIPWTTTTLHPLKNIILQSLETEERYTRKKILSIFTCLSNIKSPIIFCRRLEKNVV